MPPVLTMVMPADKFFEDDHFEAVKETLIMMPETEVIQLRVVGDGLSYEFSIDVPQADWSDKYREAVSSRAATVVNASWRQYRAMVKLH